MSILIISALAVFCYIFYVNLYFTFIKDITNEQELRTEQKNFVMFTIIVIIIVIVGFVGESL